MSKKGRKNRLQFEKSPYLLQHAENPVDWFGWGPEPFEKARRENKPIFLSIGYATCHWCHVMAHESFEDPEVARLMNEAFISIKVDREERPDIDAVYMMVCQMMTGNGGWPLSIIMTPDKKPFFSATYIPKRSRYGRIGMLELIPKIKEVWEQHTDEVLKTSDEISAILSQTVKSTASAQLQPSILDRCFTEFVHRFDEANGGFGTAPKFPSAHNLMFLLRYWKRSGERNALMMVTRTLDTMRQGGIWDHIGFGFHRYATDARWMVPHFEKMLYDQALLAYVYTEAYQATGVALYRDTAREILEFVIRKMTSTNGGFFSALDADTEGEEGKTYVWTFDEIQTVLGDKAPLFSKVFNIIPEGNHTDEATGVRTGKNIPYRSFAWHDLAQQHQMKEDKLRSLMEACRKHLFKVRKARPQPGIDDKVLTDWNGLMIGAFAKAGRVFDERAFTETALRAADFIVTELRTPDGRLLHRYRDGVAGIPAFLEDYAFFIWGLIELYGATFEARYLKTALRLNNHAIDHFWDKDAGGFFLSADDAEVLFMRKKEVYDGAIPSGNSVSMLNLLLLAAMTGDTELTLKADRMANAFYGQVSRSPSAHGFLMMGYDFFIGPSFEVVVAGRRDSKDTRLMLSKLANSFAPRAVQLFRDCGEKEPEIDEIAPFTKAQTCLAGKATAYVCRDRDCKLPTTDADEMVALLCEK